VRHCRMTDQSDTTQMTWLNPEYFELFSNTSPPPHHIRTLIWAPRETRSLVAMVTAPDRRDERSGDTRHFTAATHTVDA
jgi:hypothetical protein